MRRLLPLLFLLALASGGAMPSPGPNPQPPLTPAVGGHVTKGDPRNAAVMPEQRIDLRFDHQLHLSQVELTCTDCHASIMKSKDASDFNVPAKSVCLDCHDAAEIAGDWNAAGGKSSLLSMPASQLNFSHARHLGQEGVTCATCHPDVGKKAIATRDDLPSMETCLSCHDGLKAPNDCQTCHLKGRAGTIRTLLAAMQLKPDDHGVAWLRQHSVSAERDMGLCASCHAQEDCLTCHDGSVPPNFHDGNYLVLHPQDAMANSSPCASCHRIDRFCRDCHFRAEVRPMGPLAGTGSFHPQGWLDPGTAAHHSNVAKKNIGECMACHDGNDCASCHAFYQGAPETHPSGWATSRRRERLQRLNPELCSHCHGMGEPGDPLP